MAEPGGGAAPDSAPGLRLVEFELGDADALDALERTLPDATGAGSEPSPARAEGELHLRDPDGQPLSFRHR